MSGHGIPALMTLIFFATPAVAQTVIAPIATTDVPASTSVPALAPVVAPVVDMPGTSAPVASPVLQPVVADGCTAKLFARKAGDSDLFLVCATEALRLGPSLSFVSSYNAALGRYLVVSRTAAGERVYMIRPAAGTVPALVEDLTDDLAASARGLKVVQVKALSGGVDISGFAASGAIKLNGAAPGLPVAAGAAPVAIRVTGGAGAVRAVNPAQVAPVSEQATTGN